MQTNILMGIGAVYTSSQYYKLNQILDSYPSRLSGIVEKIKASIDQKTYEGLTNPDNNKVIDNPAIKSISDQPTKTKVVEFCDISDFVIKVTKFGLEYDLRRKINENVFGENYTATNIEGGVTQGIFSLARRVTTAKKLRRIIKENNLTKIKVPKKYLCSFPCSVTSRFSIPLDNRKVFVLCEKCDVEFAGVKTIEELKKMTQNETQTLAEQIHIFFLKSGVLDLHQNNFYIKEGQLVIFDTEPMSLTLIHNICVSPTLRMARINFRNLEKFFSRFPERNHLADEAKKSITKIHIQENQRLKRITFIAIIILSSLLLFNVYRR